MGAPWSIELNKGVLLPVYYRIKRLCSEVNDLSELTSQQRENVSPHIEIKGNSGVAASFRRETGELKRVCPIPIAQALDTSEIGIQGFLISGCSDCCFPLERIFFFISFVLK